MGRATDDELDELHSLQVAALISEIKRFKEAGEGIPPALLAQANKFLKDNGVDRAIVPGDSTSLLDEEIPEFDDNVIKGNFNV